MYEEDSKACFVLEPILYGLARPKQISLNVKELKQEDSEVLDYEGCFQNELIRNCQFENLTRIPTTDVQMTKDTRQHRVLRASIPEVNKQEEMELNSLIFFFFRILIWKKWKYQLKIVFKATSTIL